MQTAYQSDEFDDASSYHATSSDSAYEDADSDKDAEEERREHTIDARVDRQSESEGDESWWQQLGPHTRRKAPVDYYEETIIPTQAPIKVCLNGLNCLERVLRCRLSFYDVKNGILLAHMLTYWEDLSSPQSKARAS
jgi:hypothetical protein